MSESEVPAAIAQQEEHIKRSKSCREVRYRPHTWVKARGGDWRVCYVCGVTETDKDYQKKLEAQGE